MAGYPGRGEAKTSKRRLEAHQRAVQALELRKAGATYDTIAARLGVTRTAVINMVRRMLQETAAAPAAEVRELELHRLDTMILGLWQQARSGDVQAIDRVLKIMDRRASYLGLDAPKQVRVDITERVRQFAEMYGLDPDEAVAEAERIAREHVATG
jgi:DNA-binding Lrp family transcriptional regulator